jgi:hypothetical protein
MEAADGGDIDQASRQLEMALLMDGALMMTKP